MIEILGKPYQIGHVFSTFQIVFVFLYYASIQHSVIAVLKHLLLPYSPGMRRNSSVRRVQAGNRKVAGSILELGISSLCPWERRLTLFSR